MATGNICLYKKFGHCKFLDTCKHRHMETICENESCEIQSCELRHPKECKFFRDFARCKFGDYCSFKHKIRTSLSDDVTVKKALENLKSKVDILEKQNSEKDMKIQEIQDKLEILFRKKRIKPKYYQ